MAKKNNSSRRKNINRRNYLKGLTVASVGIGGFDSLSMTSFAQTGQIPAPFCGAASLPPQEPPGGQAGQCIHCVEEVCEGPVALELLHTSFEIAGRTSRVVQHSPERFDGICFTLPAADIPEGADYLTLKAGQNCFLADVPTDASSDVTFCLAQSNGQPPQLQDISNATFYACEGEDPPTAEVVEVTCDAIVIETTNIPDGEELNITITFADETMQDYTATVTGGQATVSLPGDINPMLVTITYQDNLVLFKGNVTAIDVPCGPGPTITEYEVTCASVVLQTANIPEGATLNVTGIFEDDSQETYSSEVDANGVATVDLPGDQDPERVIVISDSTIISDSFVEATDAPCKRPVCPSGLDVKYECESGEWVAVSGDPTGLSVDGDETQVTICADFPFEITYKLANGEPTTVAAEFDEETGWYCVTIGNGYDEISWFRVRCPTDKIVHSRSRVYRTVNSLDSRGTDSTSGKQ